MNGPSEILRFSVESIQSDRGALLVAFALIGGPILYRALRK